MDTALFPGVSALTASASIRLPALLAALALPFTAAAQDAQDAQGTRTRVALGVQAVPAFPGADEHKWRPLVDFERASGDETFEFEAPDDSFGFAVLRSGGFAAGPVIDVVGSRTPERLGAALPKVGTSVELGAFALQEIGEDFRLYAEVRQAVSGHDGLVASLGADAVLRDRDDWLLSVGPRVKWASGKWHDAYFGVTPADAAATGLAAYDPGSGVHSVGLAAGSHVQLGGRWGLYGYAAFDRLVRDAAKSPVTRQFGSRNQVSGGIGLSYTFGG